jgi:hypothetical protein
LEFGKFGLLNHEHCVTYKMRYNIFLAAVNDLKRLKFQFPDEILCIGFIYLRDFGTNHSRVIIMFFCVHYWSLARASTIFSLSKHGTNFCAPLSPFLMGLFLRVFPIIRITHITLLKEGIFFRGEGGGSFKLAF